jgi:aspartate racemase
MGPEATADLYLRITQNTTAQTDQDHLHIIVDSNAKIPSRQAAVLEGGEKPTAAMCETARNLQQAGADFLVIPCNAAHIFLQPVIESVTIPILSIIDETVRAVVNQVPGIAKVGLLASTAIVKTGVYADAFARKGIDTLVPAPEDQQAVLNAIFAIKAGNKSKEVRDSLHRVVSALIRQGAEAIVLACTELPLVLSHEDFPTPVVNPTEELARAAVREATGA